MLIDQSHELAPQYMLKAETVIVHSLDLMEATGASMVGPHNSYTSLVPVQPVSGVINKDCTEAECLYSSQCWCLSGDTDLQSCEAFELSTHNQPHSASQPVTPLCQIYPVHELTPMNSCCHP